MSDNAVKLYFDENPTEKRARGSKKKQYEKREFDPNRPEKKPFYDTKRKVYVIPKPRSGIAASGMPASGIEASGIPASNSQISIERKYDQLYRPPEALEEQNKLGTALLEWSKGDDARDIGIFAIKMGINPYRMKKLAETNEYFADCLQMAKYLIGSRMVDAARTREEDGNVNMKLLPLYNQDYKEMIEQQKQAEGAKVATLFNVVMEKIPSSNLVPELPKREE